MKQANLNTRILEALKSAGATGKAVHSLSTDGFGTPNTIRKALTRLKREGKVEIVYRTEMGLGRLENVWGASGVTDSNNAAVA